MVIQDVITWSSHRFLTDHLALSDDATASLNQYDIWRQQQQKSSSSGSNSNIGSVSSTGAAAAAAAEASAGVTADRAESLVDHLAADENLIMADESANRSDAIRSDVSGSRDLRSGSDAAAAAAVPKTHSADHDQTLEKASSAGLSAAAANVHLPVKPLEEKVYKDTVGEHAFLIKVFAG